MNTELANQSAQDLAAELFAAAPDAAADVATAAKSFLDAKLDKEAAEKVLGDKKEALDKAEELLMRKMEEAKVLSIKVEGANGAAYLCSFSKSDYYSLPPAALENQSIYRWLLRSGGHDLVKRSIHHATFSSFCRELAQQDKNLHPEVKKVEKKGISVRKN